MTSTEPDLPVADDEQHTRQIACHDCDLLVNVHALQEGERARCPRCNYLLTKRDKHSAEKILVYSSCSLFFLLLSVLFPFLSLNFSGQEREITLLNSVNILISNDYPALAIFMVLSVLMIPIVFLGGEFYVFLSIKLKRLLPGIKPILRLVIMILPWSMAEIFLLGILIGFIKIVALADIAFGLSFWSFLLFILSMSVAIVLIDKHQTWNEVNRLSNE